MRYSDEQLGFWIEIFTACRMQEEGLTLRQFLQDPWGWLRHLGQETAPGCLKAGFLPLLPAQAQVARRLREEERAQEEGRRREGGNKARRRAVMVGGYVH